MKYNRYLNLNKLCSSYKFGQKEKGAILIKNGYSYLSMQEKTDQKVPKDQNVSRGQFYLLGRILFFCRFIIMYLYCSIPILIDTITQQVEGLGRLAILKLIPHNYFLLIQGLLEIFHL